MPQSQRTVVVGVFEDPAQAQLAVAELREMGFHEDQFGVVAKGEGAAPLLAPVGTSRVEEGAATGALAGAGVGALWALGIAVGAVPGIGPVLVGGGLLASLLVSAVAVAAVGGVVGALIGLGIPEDEARWYEEEVQSGRTLVTVRADGRYNEVYAVLRRHGAYDMGSRPSPAGGDAAEPAAPPVVVHVAATGADQPRAVPLPPEDQTAGRTQSPGTVAMPGEPGTVAPPPAPPEAAGHTTLDVPVQGEAIPPGPAPAGAACPTEGAIRVPVYSDRVYTEKHDTAAPVRSDEHDTP